MHYWGDGFDFDGLYKAEKMIWRLSRMIGLFPLTKEKYGTIRYELLPLWGFSDNKVLRRIQMHLFRLIVKATVIRFPKFKKEILEDYNCNFFLRIK